MTKKTASVAELEAMVLADTRHNETVKRTGKGALICRCFVLPCGKVLGSPDGLEARALAGRLRQQQAMRDSIAAIKAKLNKRGIINA